jgi:hypothetical protein
MKIKLRKKSKTHVGKTQLTLKAELPFSGGPH